MVHRSVQYCHETISHPVFQQEVLKIPDPGGFISPTRWFVSVTCHRM